MIDSFYAWTLIHLTYYQNENDSKSAIAHYVCFYKTFYDVYAMNDKAIAKLEGFEFKTSNVGIDSKIKFK